MARGALTPSEVTECVGPHWLPARRFGVEQKGKCRAVDDYSVYGHNDATSLPEKIDVGGIDEVVHIARAMLMAVDASRRSVQTALADGTVLEGILHPEFDTAGARMLSLARPGT